MSTTRHVAEDQELEPEGCQGEHVPVDSLACADTQFTRPGNKLKSWAVLSFDRFIDVPFMQNFVRQ